MGIPAELFEQRQPFYAVPIIDSFELNEDVYANWICIHDVLASRAPTDEDSQ